MLGTTLRLPGQFFSPPDSDAPQNHTEYAGNLESELSSVRAPPPVWQRNQRFYADPCLYSSKYCVIRSDGKKSLFKLPYKGPYKIISRNDKIFTLSQLKNFLIMLVGPLVCRLFLFLTTQFVVVNALCLKELSNQPDCGGFDKHLRRIIQHFDSFVFIFLSHFKL